MKTKLNPNERIILSHLDDAGIVLVLSEFQKHGMECAINKINDLVNLDDIVDIFCEYSLECIVEFLIENNT